MDLLCLEGLNLPPSKSRNRRLSTGSNSSTTSGHSCEEGSKQSYLAKENRRWRRKSGKTSPNIAQTIPSVQRPIGVPKSVIVWRWSVAQGRFRPKILHPNRSDSIVLAMDNLQQYRNECSSLSDSSSEHKYTEDEEPFQFQSKWQSDVSLFDFTSNFLLNAYLRSPRPTISCRIGSL